MRQYPTLCDAALAVLQAADPQDKIAITQSAADEWRHGRLALIGETMPPERPARLEKPELRPASAMPKRSKANNSPPKAATWPM